MKAVFCAVAFASAHRAETTQLLVNWLRLDREVAERSYELGKRSWSDGGVVSDAAVQTLVDQSLRRTHRRYFEDLRQLVESMIGR